MASFFVMGFKDNTPADFPQIPPFSPKKQPSKLPIDIGDEKARKFYEDYHHTIKNFCMGFFRNNEEAEDIANDVFAYVLEKFKKEELSNIKEAYLFKAAKNMGINRKKRERARVRKELNAIYIMAAYASLQWFISNVDEEGNEKWEAGIIDNGYEQVEAKIIVKAILDEQDETTRKIYFLKYHLGMTLEEIGKAVGLGTATVHDRLKALEKQVRLKTGSTGK